MMLPAKIRIWKKNSSNKWVFYAQVFTLTPTATPDSMEVQRIARLVQRGWIAYDAEFKAINSKTPVVDFDFFSVDCQPYEKHLQNLDPDGYKAGESFRKFLSDWDARPKYIRVKENDEIYMPDIPAEVAKAEHEQVVKQAAADYRAGKKIPKYLFNDVMNYFSHW